MTRIVFAGAEVPSNRVILEKAGVNAMGVSVWGLVKRGLPKTKKYLLENYFPEHTDIFVSPGIPKDKEFSLEELEDFCVEYEQFIIENLDRITMFTEVEHPNLPESFIAEQRRTIWSDVPEMKFAPVFTGEHLESLGIGYLNVAFPGRFAENDKPILNQIRKLSAQHGSHFHALGVADPDLLRNSPFDTASTLAWLSPMMRGETIVWDGTKLVRYPKRMKDQARPRYKAAYEKAGLDFDKILADDAVEVSRLAVWSYQQFEAWNKRTDLVTMSDEIVPDPNAETPPADVTKRGADVRKLKTRNPDEIRTLPVFSVEVSRVIEPDGSGQDVLKDVPVLRTTGASMRICDTCFIKDNCPAYTPASTCAFNLPVEVKTKEQLKSLINALLEMQGQRIAFAKFAEELNGGYPDPNVGQEMDRFFKMLESVKKLDDSKEMIRMTVERQNSGGVLSSLFGDRAQVLRELPNNGLDENQTNEIIKRVDPDHT